MKNHYDSLDNAEKQAVDALTEYKLHKEKALREDPEAVRAYKNSIASTGRGINLALAFVEEKETPHVQMVKEVRDDLREKAGWADSVNGTNPTLRKAEFSYSLARHDSQQPLVDALSAANKASLSAQRQR